MGVISITQRSESLGNIHSAGTPRRAASTDIGTVHRASRAIYTPIYREKHSHDGDDALVRGLSRLGDAGRAMVDLGVQIQNREDNRQADLISQAVMFNVDREDRDARDIDDCDTPERQHLTGQKRGLLLRTGEGCRDLPKEAEDLYGNTFKQIADSVNATEKQRQLATERLYGYRRARQNRMLEIQASEYRKTELGNATGNLEEYVKQWKQGNNGVVADIFMAKERLGILEGKAEPLRKAEQGKLAVGLAEDLTRSKIRGCQSEAEFDDLEKSIGKGAEEFMPVEIKSRLPDGKLGGDSKDALLDDLKKARRSFKAEQKLVEHETQEAARNKALQTVKQLHLAPVPQTDEAQAAYFDKMGDAYAAMAMTPGLDEATSANYAKTAQSLRFRAVGERNATAAATKTAQREAAREQRERVREAKAQLKEAQEETFSTVENEFNIGGYRTNDGEWHDMDANEMADRAMKLLNEKKITRVQFNKLMAIQKPKMDEENLAFRDLVLADVKNLLPNVGYRNGRFQFKPTKDVTVTKSTGVGFDTGSRWYWSNPREEYTYGELIKAMNITLKWQQMNKKTPAEAKEHFDDLTKGIIRGHQRATVKDVLEDAEQLNNDWRNLHGL